MNTAAHSGKAASAPRRSLTTRRAPCECPGTAPQHPLRPVSREQLLQTIQHVCADPQRPDEHPKQVAAMQVLVAQRSALPTPAPRGISSAAPKPLSLFAGRAQRSTLVCRAQSGAGDSTTATGITFGWHLSTLSTCQQQSSCPTSRRQRRIINTSCVLPIYAYHVSCARAQVAYRYRRTSPHRYRSQRSAVVMVAMAAAPVTTAAAAVAVAAAATAALMVRAGSSLR